jgi:hypothetical protein
MSWLSKLLRGRRSKPAPPPPPPPPPRESEAEIAERLRREREAAERALRDERLPLAIEDTRRLATNTLERRGIPDQDYYMNLVDQAINRTAQAVPDTETQPIKYFSPSLVEAALEQGAQDRRQRFLRDVGTLFGPDAEWQYIPDTTGRDIIDRVLNTQRNEALSAIDRARARGNLTEVGISGAMQRIGELERAGRQQASSLVANALQGLRDEFGNIRNRARNAAESYVPGGSFSLEPFAAQKQSFLDTLNERIPGAAYNALAGQSFFDIGDILTSGGRLQGAQNPRIAAFVPPQRSDNKEDRHGLRSTL